MLFKAKKLTVLCCAVLRTNIQRKREQPAEQVSVVPVPLAAHQWTAPILAFQIAAKLPLAPVVSDSHSTIKVTGRGSLAPGPH